jgi:hypothetical protein
LRLHHSLLIEFNTRQRGGGGQMSRLIEWVKEQKQAGMSEYEIAAGLDNGEVERPEWMGSSPCTAIGYAIWDTAESSGQTKLYNLDTECPTDND